MGAGRPPLQVHSGDCHMSGKRRRPVDRDEARRLLSAGLKAYTHCQPAGQLHIIDLSRSEAIRPREAPACRQDTRRQEGQRV
ncbi:DUF6233 domain-containing protein [Streptomyces sp. NPDC020571]|uniref:DUF6233 domain-containing protein n=1 Tax=Streptomyces sp. NPDC020571 TaxID=3365079 RepID=UPI0037BE039B